MTAAGAEAVEFETVGLDRKSVTGGDLFLQFLDFTIFEFDDFPATGANEVVVVALM